MGLFDGAMALANMGIQGLSALGTHDIEKSNLRHQKDVLNYQKGLQKTIFDREDTSIMRRVKDLKSAGLSPVLAAGQGARAGSPIPVTAPKQEKQSLQMASELGTKAIGFQQALKDVSKTNAEIDLIKQQKDKINAEKMETLARTARTQQTTRFESELLPARVKELSLRNVFNGRSLEKRIQHLNANVTESENNAKRLYYSQRNEMHRAALNSINVHYQEELLRFVKQKFEETGTNYNPEILKVISAELAYKIKQYDFQWYKNMQFPVSGGLGTPERIGGSLTNILNDIFKR